MTRLYLLLAGLLCLVVLAVIPRSAIHGNSGNPPPVIAAPAPVPVAPPADYTAALTAIAHHTEQLQVCRRRTEDLRLALDTLIRTAPRAWNLEHLPVVGAEGWPAWPRVGQAREHVRVQDWDGKDGRR